MRNKNKRMLWLLAMVLLASSIAFAQDDVKRSKDHPLFNRMPGFRITQYDENDFDVYEKFRDSKGKKTSVEGHYYAFTYGLKKEVQPPSNVQIIRNYINAVTKIGGTVIYQDANNAYMKLEKDNKITWVRAYSYTRGQSYQLWIIEEAAMKQDIVADAKSMAQDISTTGRVALYGIYFDFGKAEVKPESEAVLKEIAKLLQQNPKLNLYVVGHTDNVGTLNSNMELSKLRAAAVVKALISRHGIDSKRFHPDGVGPLAPVTSNKAEEGRAKNRRVELVEQ